MLYVSIRIWFNWRNSASKKAVGSSLVLSSTNNARNPCIKSRSNILCCPRWSWTGMRGTQPCTIVLASLADNSKHGSSYDMNHGPCRLNTKPVTSDTNPFECVHRASIKLISRPDQRPTWYFRPKMRQKFRTISPAIQNDEMGMQGSNPLSNKQECAAICYEQQASIHWAAKKLVKEVDEPKSK